MVNLKVQGIHCEGCVARIREVFTEEGLQFDVSLENKTVTVPDSKVEEAIELLDDLGFEDVVQL